eukprot:COSAG02_NODE_218_length_28570_cov_75.594816_15_plen_108_part_00
MELVSYGEEPRAWQKDDGERVLRSLKHACYGWLSGNDKLINPPHVRQHVLTYLWKEFRHSDMRYRDCPTWALFIIRVQGIRTDRRCMRARWRGGRRGARRDRDGGGM